VAISCLICVESRSDMATAWSERRVLPRTERPSIRKQAIFPNKTAQRLSIQGESGRTGLAPGALTDKTGRT
jgi:hypothetical protein